MKLNGTTFLLGRGKLTIVFLDGTKTVVDTGLGAEAHLDNGSTLHVKGPCIDMFYEKVLSWKIKRY